jgi:hypothetical protein
LPAPAGDGAFAAVLLHPLHCQGRQAEHGANSDNNERKLHLLLLMLLIAHWLFIRMRESVQPVVRHL